MTRAGTRPRWRLQAVSGLIACAAVLGLMAAWGDNAGYRLNLTPSEPVGLWRITRGGIPRRGEYVGFCAPVARYPFLEAGKCANGLMPFVKEIVGVPGDRIVETGNGVTVDGRGLPESRPHRRARDGTRLPQWHGHMTLGPGRYWTYGSGDPEWSFDSRYFGPLPRGRIRFVAHPVWTVGGGTGSGG